MLLRRGGSEADSIRTGGFEQNPPHRHCETQHGAQCEKFADCQRQNVLRLLTRFEHRATAFNHRDHVPIAIRDSNQSAASFPGDRKPLRMVDVWLR